MLFVLHLYRFKFSVIYIYDYRLHKIIVANVFFSSSSPSSPSITMLFNTEHTSSQSLSAFFYSQSNENMFFLLFSMSSFYHSVSLFARTFLLCGVSQSLLFLVCSLFPSIEFLLPFLFYINNKMKFSKLLFYSKNKKIIQYDHNRLLALHFDNSSYFKETCIFWFELQIRLHFIDTEC